MSEVVVEQLLACPLCKRSGFTRSGIQNHRCPALPRGANGMRQRLPQAITWRLLGIEEKGES